MSVTVVLGAAAIEITPDPTANNTTELIPKIAIIGVYPVKFNKKPSNANLFYSGISSPASLGDTVTGLTSGATGTIYAFIGTTGFELIDVVGDFQEGETLLFNSLGFSYAGTAAATGPFVGVTGATSGAGVGATFDVSDASGSGTYDTVTVNTPGTGYLPGDTITILGTDLGGATPANDLVITYTGETATVDSIVPTSFENEWVYWYPTMTIIEVLTTDERRFNIELQDISNQPTWNDGTLAAQQQAIADINAWL